MLDLVKSAARRMLGDFEDSKRIEHNPTKGRAREYSVIENFLQPYLPSRYSIGSGIIIDANNNSSKQQDLVVYDEFFTPVLKSMDSESLFFPESVYAVFEVKSTLRHRDIEDITLKSASVWDLMQVPNREIKLAPNISMPSARMPPLCIGLCFESEYALEDTIPRLRKVRDNTRSGHALSILCVLNDKDDNAGLVINVNKDNLNEVTLTPHPSSRFALIKCDTPGDALLSMYLLLMEHLRLNGLVNPGPNLLHHAKLNGLDIPERQIPKEELEGAAVVHEGERIEMDAVRRMSALTKKVLGPEGSATDEEIMEWFVLLPKMPKASYVLEPNTVFVENGKILDLPGTARVHAAVKRCRTGKSDSRDKEIAKKFIRVIRSIREQNRTLEFVRARKDEHT